MVWAVCLFLAPLLIFGSLGVPFLFRVGLAIASCCRKQLLEARDGHTALALLSEPPSECLPDNVEAFVTLAYSMKLKDDDIQKQRLKMEAQLRKQNQQSRPARTPGGPTMIVRRT
jgi:TBC1 domain family member 10